MPLLTPATIAGSLDAHDLRPSRALGQNFLADPNTARRIVRLAGVEPGDRVLEIGPGIGSLTSRSPRPAHASTALELDRHLCPRSTRWSPSLPERCRGRARATRSTVDLDALAPTGRADAAGSCVANLPYNVATPMVARLLEDAPTVELAVVMVQREVGERLAAPPGGKDYGAISVKVAYYGRGQGGRRWCPPTVFMPPPEGRLRARASSTATPTPPVDVPSPDALFTLVRAGFAQRRKMLRRALQPVLGDRDAGGPRRRRASTRRPGPRRSTSRSGPRCTRRPRPREPSSVRVRRAPSSRCRCACSGAARRVPRARGAHRLGRRSRTTCSRRSSAGARGVRLEVERAGGRGVPADDDNLAVRAATAAAARRRSGLGVHPCCTRRSRRAPGSAAAPPTPRPCCRCVRELGLDLDDAGVAAPAAAELGSDVPFCLHGGAGLDAGPGRGHRAGRGRPTRLHVLVVRPAVPARDAGRLPGLGRARRPRRTRAVPAPRRWSRSSPSWSTTSSPPPSTSSPGCAPFREALEAAAGAPALLAGSGSAYVVPFADASAAAGLAIGSRRRLRRPEVGRRAFAGGDSPAERARSRSGVGQAPEERVHRRSRRSEVRLPALLTTLPARLLQKLLVLLLPHALAALLDQ